MYAGCCWPSFNCLRSLSSELGLERFDSRFRSLGAGIINEVLLVRHPQASTVPIIWTSASSLCCSNLRPFTHRPLHWVNYLPPTNYKLRHHWHAAFRYQGPYIFKQCIALLSPHFTLGYVWPCANVVVRCAYRESKCTAMWIRNRARYGYLGTEFLCSAENFQKSEDHL